MTIVAGPVPPDPVISFSSASYYVHQGGQAGVGLRRVDDPGATFGPVSVGKQGFSGFIGHFEI